MTILSLWVVILAALVAGLWGAYILVRDWRRVNKVRNAMSPLLNIMPDLAKLRGDLRYFDNLAHRPLALVQFFQAVSKWHDRGMEDVISTLSLFHGWRYAAGTGYEKLLPIVHLLNNHFWKAGRDLYGWNRTKPGEEVTPDNVFLGNVYGLFTKPVSFWFAAKDDPKAGAGLTSFNPTPPAREVGQQGGRDKATSLASPTLLSP